MSVAIIEDALRKVDFEIMEQDKNHFYHYIFTNHYKCDYPYENEVGRTPNYFKFLHQMIQPFI